MYQCTSKINDKYCYKVTKIDELVDKVDELLSENKKQIDKIDIQTEKLDKMSGKNKKLKKVIKHLVDKVEDIHEQNEDIIEKIEDIYDDRVIKCEKPDDTHMFIILKNNCENLEDEKHVSIIWLLDKIHLISNIHYVVF